MRGESELGHKTFVFFADSVKNNAFSLKASIEHRPETVVCGIGLLLFVAAAIFVSALNY